MIAWTSTAPLACALAFALAACGSPPKSDSGGSADSLPAADAQVVDDIQVSTPDTQLPLDAAAGDAGGADCPGGPSCPCTTNAECSVGYCIEDDASATGKACARGCQESCPDRYTCAQVSAASGDLVSLCVPRFGHLCEPCDTSKACESPGVPGSACIDEGPLGRFCGVQCQGATDCPAGYECQDVQTSEGAATRQCVVPALSGTGGTYGTCACSAKAIAQKLETGCYLQAKDATGAVVGKCPGKRACGAKGLSECSASAASAEVCNGQDDNCDGKTDEGTCDDGETCTQDSCGGVKGCTHAGLTGIPCDADGNACTVGDSCDAGVCKPGKAKPCDDKNPCTIDSCDPAKGCTQTLDDGLPCDDDDPCTLGDVCGGGSCLGGAPKVCKAPDACTTAKCDVTQDGKCKYTQAKDGVSCDDGNACSGPDLCSGGDCSGQALVCQDGNPCTTDGCDVKSGCSSQPVSGPCDDGDACTTAESCSAGSCKGVAKSCEDGNACTTDSCDSKGGCTHTASSGACDDGDLCTSSDACANSVCKGAAIDCDDGLGCTIDSCDKAKGCTHVATTEACSDGDACTAGDSCKTGTCVPGPTVPCDDGNPCTVDNCDKIQGCVHPIVDGAPCSGGSCQAGVCKSVQIAEVVSGLYFSCARLVGGTVACWGSNGTGQLGDGTTVDKVSAVTVVGLTDVVQLSAGSEHTCAVKKDGTAWCWGGNNTGQLGDNTLANHSKPVQVKNLAGVKAIAAGNVHTCALLTDASVRCWGAGGTLGDGKNANSMMPGLPVDKLPAVVDITAGSDATCARTQAGVVWCWGNNNAYELGPGFPTVALVASTAGVMAKSVALGYSSGCVVQPDGKVLCWGSGFVVPGASNPYDKAEPELVPGLDDAVTVTMKAYNACALRANGTTWCWGANGSAQAGQGHASLIAAPGPVTAIGSATSIAPGQAHTCARVADGTVQCWGAPGALGSGAKLPGYQSSPVQVKGVTGAVSVTLGQYHGCAALASGKTVCWGHNAEGELGTGDLVYQGMATPVAYLDDAVQVVAGMQFTCAVESQGLASCWGANGSNQLGKSGAGSLIPVGQSPAVYNVTQMAASALSVSVISGAKVWRWGGFAMPVQVVGLPAAPTSVAQGYNHACALLVDGSLWCWGDNDSGQFGNGTTKAVPENTAIPGAGLSAVVAIAAGGNSTCAIAAGGKVWCWGVGSQGQLGDGKTVDKQANPVNVQGIVGATAISVGYQHACAVIAGGKVWCWGGGGPGLQPGAVQLTPLEVPDMTGVIALSAGESGTCAIRQDGTVWCWGQRGSGQLGDGKDWQASASQVGGFL